MVFTGVSEFSVTCKEVLPEALSDWVWPILSGPRQMNTPLPRKVSMHALVK